LERDVLHLSTVGAMLTMSGVLVRCAKRLLSAAGTAVFVSLPIAILLIASMGSLSAFAEDSKPEVPDEKELAKRALEISRKEAGLWNLELGTDRKQKLKLNADPVLRWSNPSAGEIYGAVFVWTSEGRPQVVGSIYKWYSPYKHYSTEFQSLAETTITGSRDGKETWTPDRAGVAFKPVPEAPQPAEGAATRLRQMREIAADFVATKTDREGNQQKMRLLTQPIYRYESKAVAVLDGGLFTFVEGTDPEVFLVLEARHEKDCSRWHYALTRMNSTKFEATYKGNQVWNVEVLPWSQVRDRNEPYTTFQYNTTE
jgi:hypothetical protein